MTHTIVIDRFVYGPETLTVKQGETVVWRNNDPVPHTATAKDRGFDSGGIGGQQTWTYVATKPGTYSYLCTFHPGMQGTLIVK